MKIVVKVGTSTLAHATGRLNIRHVEELVKVLSDLTNAGHQIILVSSGAIGMGVGTAEIKVGDNDPLGAVVACTVKADLLVLLSDIQGLYTADPRKDPGARLIPVVEEITADIEALAGGAGSGLGTGGMATKLRAARMVTGQGCDMIITNGDQPQLLYDIVEGKQVGTRFLGRRA